MSAKTSLLEDEVALQRKIICFLFIGGLDHCRLLLLGESKSGTITMQVASNYKQRTNN